MKKRKFIELLVCGLLASSCSGDSDAEKNKEKNENKTASDNLLNKSDVSYALGYNIGEVLTETDSTLFLNDLTSGLKDAFTKSGSPRMDEEEVKKLLMMYNLEISKAMNQKRQALLDENIRKGSEFQTRFLNQTGVQKLANGLLYKEIKKGTGLVPKENDHVVVEYTGKNIDGEVFFSTKEQGQPANFTVANVIQGWKTALQEMPEGSIWEIVVPPELAYGEKGVGEVIGPGQTLIFEMELLEIQEEQPE